MIKLFSHILYILFFLDLLPALICWGDHIKGHIVWQEGVCVCVRECVGALQLAEHICQSQTNSFHSDSALLSDNKQQQTYIKDAVFPKVFCDRLYKTCWLCLFGPILTPNAVHGVCSHWKNCYAPVLPCDNCQSCSVFSCTLTFLYSLNYTTTTTIHQFPPKPLRNILILI